VKNYEFFYPPLPLPGGDYFLTGRRGDYLPTARRELAFQREFLIPLLGGGGVGKV